MTKRADARSSGQCRKRIEQLFAYLDGELTPSRRRTIEAHLDGCHCCGDLAASVRRAIAACQADGHTGVPARVHRRAIAEARKRLRHSIS
jgi:anti-sigma factor RsiW